MQTAAGHEAGQRTGLKQIKKDKTKKLQNGQQALMSKGTGKDL